MRLLRKTRKVIGYKNYVGKKPVVIDDMETGEYEIEHTDKQSLVCTITPRSNTNTNINGVTFAGYIGNRTDYQKIILTTDLNCDIDENTLLFIESQDEPDFKVSALSRCKTHLAFVAEKIE